MFPMRLAQSSGRHRNVPLEDRFTVASSPSFLLVISAGRNKKLRLTATV